LLFTGQKKESTDIGATDLFDQTIQMDDSSGENNKYFTHDQDDSDLQTLLNQQSPPEDTPIWSRRPSISLVIAVSIGFALLFSGILGAAQIIDIPIEYAIVLMLASFCVVVCYRFLSKRKERVERVETS
jgi:hypothetical protein